MADMRTVEFYAGKNGGVKTLHIETDGCIINVRVGLTDRYGRKVTSVTISPEDETRSPDLDGYYWRQVDGSRIVRDLQPGMRVEPDAIARDCKFCGMGIRQENDGLWYIVPLVANADADALAACSESVQFPNLHQPR